MDAKQNPRETVLIAIGMVFIVLGITVNLAFIGVGGFFLVFGIGSIANQRADDGSPPDPDALRQTPEDEGAPQA